MLSTYVLDGKTPVTEPDPKKWEGWMKKACRTVRYDTATVRLAGNKIGEVRVSTVFLGMDHQLGKGPPLLFETLVFGGPIDQEQDRCSTWEAAEKMHELMCERVKRAAREVDDELHSN